MIVRGGAWRRGWVQALVSMLMIAAAAAPAFPAADDTAGPAWLRSPLTRGPVAASLGLDTHHVWWGIDAALPLNLGPARVPTSASSTPALGLGLSIAGQRGSDARGVRYSALVDHRSQRAGAWLGLSTGGRSPGSNTRLQLGTGLWRSLAHVEVEAGVVSSFVDYQAREASHWLVGPDRLHNMHDTTTYEMVNHSGLWQTAHSALRWHYGLMELTATGGVTIGPRIEPRRWAQAIVNVQASRSLKVMAAYGQRPAASIVFDPSMRAQTMVGVQLTPWASRGPSSAATKVPLAQEWSTRPLGDGRIAFRVRCKDASRVELAGDFTDWAPVELTASGGGQWETTLTILPGLHQVQIRLDGGAWMVPPGLPNTQGEFAGTAGVLLID